VYHCYSALKSVWDWEFTLSHIPKIAEEKQHGLCQAETGDSSRFLRLLPPRLRGLAGYLGALFGREILCPGFPTVFRKVALDGAYIR
jgi:hypothetical protein